MVKILKPMLAGTFDPAKAKYPYIATPKIDGIRFLMVEGKALSRSFKPIRNLHIQQMLSTYLPDGVDGELTCGESFHQSSSAIMSVHGKPDFKVWIFDYVDPNSSLILPYKDRLKGLTLGNSPPFDLEILQGIEVCTPDELETYEAIVLWEGHEGVMIRDPDGGYKFGRATVRENTLLKVKRFTDAEAVLIDIEEKLINNNPAQSDAFGLTKRSTSQTGMIPAGTTGALLVRDDSGREFHIGSGLDDAMRDEIWKNKEKYLGSIVKYKYLEHGAKEKPRHPVFLGFRHPDDL